MYIYEYTKSVIVINKKIVFFFYVIHTFEGQIIRYVTYNAVRPWALLINNIVKDSWPFI